MSDHEKSTEPSPSIPLVEAETAAWEDYSNSYLRHVVDGKVYWASSDMVGVRHAFMEGWKAGRFGND